MKLWKIDCDGESLVYWVVADAPFGAVADLLKVEGGLTSMHEVEYFEVSEQTHPMTTHNTEDAADDGKEFTAKQIIAKCGPGIALCSEW